MRIVHVVDAMGADRALWGKERVIQSLMRAQRAVGLDPELVCFLPGRLARAMEEEGFRVECLEERHRLLPTRSLQSLARVLASDAPPVVHTHGYKANVLGRIARMSGVQMRALISTCHGWDEQTWRLWLYNRVDRRSSYVSDVVTVPDAAMAAAFSHPERVRHVANAVEFRPLPSAQERARARGRLGFREDDFVIGFLGRVDRAKGALDVVEAAARTQKLGVVWALAGTGSAQARVLACGLENVRSLGYVDDVETYLAALDTYVQASYHEGLSLSLLEAMRAGLPSLATRVGSTQSAVRHDVEGLLFSPGDVDDLVQQALFLKSSPTLCRRLGASARRRFETNFDVLHQHRAFLDLYQSCGKTERLAIAASQA